MRVIPFCLWGRVAGNWRPGGAVPASWPRDTQLRMRAAVPFKQAVKVTRVTGIARPLRDPLRAESKLKGYS